MGVNQPSLVILTPAPGRIKARVSFNRLTVTANVYLNNLYDPTRDYTSIQGANGDITIRSLDAHVRRSAPGRVIRLVDPGNGLNRAL